MKPIRAVFGYISKNRHLSISMYDEKEKCTFLYGCPLNVL